MISVLVFNGEHSKSQSLELTQINDGISGALVRFIGVQTLQEFTQIHAGFGTCTKLTVV